MLQFFRRLWYILPFWSDPFAELKIPRRLYRAGRRQRNEFDDYEEIYRRFNIDGSIGDWKKSNAVSAAVIPVKDDSANRSRYSMFPRDVLYNTRPQDKGAHYWNHGILSFSVKAFKCLPIVPIKNNGVQRNFSFHLEHKPEECMYPHTEIWVLEEGQRVNTEAPKSVRASVRLSLLGISDIIKERTSSSDELSH